MKKVRPGLKQIQRTEQRDFISEKIRSIRSYQGEEQAIIFPDAYLVKDKYSNDTFLVYDGNSRLFLAEQGIIKFDKFLLIETDDDLVRVRSEMSDIYWPGQDLSEVAGYLDAAARHLKSLQERFDKKTHAYS